MKKTLISTPVTRWQVLAPALASQWLHVHALHKLFNALSVGVVGACLKRLLRMLGNSNRRLLLALPQILLMSVACVHPAAVQERPQIVFASNGFEIYSSASRKVTRQMCDTLAIVSLPADLPPDTLTRIAMLAKQSGFFGLPDGFAEPKPRRFVGEDGEKYEEVLISSPCWSTALEISYHGERNRIAWSCQGDNVARARPEVVALEEALKSHFDKLPRQPCFLR